MLATKGGVARRLTMCSSIHVCVQEQGCCEWSQVEAKEETADSEVKPCARSVASVPTCSNSSCPIHDPSLSRVLLHVCGLRLLSAIFAFVMHRQIPYECACPIPSFLSAHEPISVTDSYVPCSNWQEWSFACRDRSKGCSVWRLC